MRPRPTITEFLEQLKQSCSEFLLGLKQLRQQFALPADTKMQQALNTDYANLGSNFWPLGPYDIAILEDISASMGTTDFQPSRLEGGKKGIGHFVRLRARVSPEDRIAIVTFTETAETVLPFTPITEIDTIVNKLKILEPQDGTDIRAGLKECKKLFLSSTVSTIREKRFKRVLVLTDGHGGKPLKVADELKNELNVLVEIIGIAGEPSEVNEKLLRKVATTDPDGFTHYWFIRDTNTLITHYGELATGLVWKGKEK